MTVTREGVLGGSSARNPGAASAFRPATTRKIGPLRWRPCMLDARQLRQTLQALAKGDENSRRQVIQALKERKPEEWQEVASEISGPLVDALQSQLTNGTKQTFYRKDV